jgi:hypothetical protein
MLYYCHLRIQLRREKDKARMLAAKPGGGQHLQPNPAGGALGETQVKHPRGKVHAYLAYLLSKVRTLMGELRVTVDPKGGKDEEIPLI